jgi:acyl-CoA synthetase (NDP forming)
VSKPLDITAQGLVEPDIYARCLAALFGDDRFGAIVVGIIQTDPMTMGIKVPPILRAVGEIRSSKPVIFAGLDEGAGVPEAHVSALRALGIPYFPSTERAFRALKRLMDLSARDFAESTSAPMRLEGLPSVGGVIPEHRAKALLAQLGIPFPKGRFAATVDEAVVAADAIGYPVVIKAQSPDLSHKSDAGGVALSLADADAVRNAWTRMYQSVGLYDPSIMLEGVLVEGMGKRGVELIIGARNDPDWGPVILAGFGGVAAEVLHDVRLMTPDLTLDAIERELGCLKQAPLLHGYRGAPPLDVRAVAELIAKLGQLMTAEPSIMEIDLNPVIVYPEGEALVALDALMLTAAR